MPRFLLRRRQLMSNLTLTPTNHTTNNPCPDFCDPACDNFEECYTFPDAGYPLPPLPPPLPPFTVVVSPVTTTATTTQGAHVSPVVIVIVVVLASIFLLFSYYAVVIKYCTFWNRRAHEELPRSDSDLGGSRGRDALVQENGDHDPMVVDHPIWLISTIGLHQSVINAITMVRYKRGDGLIDGSDCSVCLCEFQEGETLRLLPKCSHAFHIDCIDTWLRSHTNCPLCRAAVVANSGRQSLASNEPSFGHSRRVELFNPAVDLDSSDVELGRPQTGNNSSRVVEIGDNANNVAHNDHTNNKTEAGFNSIIIRSFSMDYFRGSNFHNNSSSGLTREMDSSSSSRPQPLRPSSMKRSYSWSGRVFWSSCSQNNSSRDISP